MRELKGIKFPFQFRAGSVATSEGNNYVLDCVCVLLGINKGEYLYLPEYGTDLRKRIFDPINVTSLIESDIKIAIAKFEPRVELVDIKTEIV